MATPESPIPHQPEINPEQSSFDYLWNLDGRLIQSTPFDGGLQTIQSLAGRNCEFRITKTAIRGNTIIETAIVPKGEQEPHEVYICDKTGVVEHTCVTRLEGSPSMPFLTPPIPKSVEGTTLRVHLAVKIAQFVQEQTETSKGDEITSSIEAVEGITENPVALVIYRDLKANKDMLYRLNYISWATDYYNWTYEQIKEGLDYLLDRGFVVEEEVEKPPILDRWILRKAKGPK